MEVNISNLNRLFSAIANRCVICRMVNRSSSEMHHYLQCPQVLSLRQQSSIICHHCLSPHHIGTRQSCPNGIKYISKCHFACGFPFNSGPCEFNPRNGTGFCPKDVLLPICWTWWRKQQFRSDYAFDIGVIENDKAFSTWLGESRDDSSQLNRQFSNAIWLFINICSRLEYVA